jgi:glycerate 2-kinase
MRVLICPDKFKGSATADEVASAIADGLRSEVAKDFTVKSLPLADGGDGTLDVLAQQAGSRVFTTDVTGPLGDRVTAQWGMLADGTAIVEMAKASGLALVTGPLRACDATTFGTGELIMHAIRAGATRCIVAVGGSATTDGGLGALEALEWSLHGLPVVVASDVTTTFVDAASVFGPQKGASPEEVTALVQRLEQLADRYEHKLSVDVRCVPRSGAAGGLAGGLYAIGAELVSGFDMVAELVGLDDHLDWADLVITGEGRFDATSFLGKPVGGIIARCGERSLPVVVVCGSSDSAADCEAAKRAAAIHQLIDLQPDAEIAIAHPGPLLQELGRRIGRSL